MKQIGFIFVFIFLSSIILFSKSENTSVNTPDLIVVNQTITPSTVLQGSNFSISCHVTNTGTSQATFSKLGYYLSTDTLWNANTDMYLGKDAVGTTHVGILKPESATFEVPISLSAGNYYILFVADYLNVISESDETNNVSYVSLTVSSQHPNIATHLYSDTLSIAGTTLTIGFTAENNGLGTFPASQIGYYLSTDTIINTSDYWIGSDALDALAVFDTIQKQYIIDISTLTTIPAGTYYAGYILDEFDLIYELIEVDNIACFSNLQITKPNCTAPDLVVPNAPLSTSNLPVTSNVQE